MGLRDRMYELKTPEEVEQFLEKFPTCALFKAGGCHKTMQGFGYVEEALEPYEQISLGFVKVLESRPASNYIAEVTAVQHQSPQMILILDGEPVYDVDNWDITLEALEEALMTHCGAACKTTGKCCVEMENMSSYLDLLERFVSGEMEESDFRNQWLSSFQSDASLRSAKEFELLNRLFGDVDAAIESSNPLSIIGKSDSLLERASHLLQDLKVYQ